jgi:hypothetical protein
MPDRYLSTDQVITSDSFPFTRGQLNHYLTQRHKNGLNSAVRKIGKRIYFHEPSLVEWIESQTEDKSMKGSGYEQE